MNWNTELIHAVIVGGLYLAIFAAAEVWRIAFRPKTEITRKFVHFVSGAVCLSFSYLFSSHWTVLALSGAFMVIMLVTKKLGLLASVHDVDRRSSGGMYYPVAIYFTFLIAHNAARPELYCIAILVLAVADSLAALVGGKYGFKLYKVEDDHKSLEGSIIFFFTTFLIVHLGLLLQTPMGRAESVLAAAYIALLVTAFESISLSGADNLFIPLGTIAVLLRVTDATVVQLVSRLAVVSAVFGLVFVIARFRKNIGVSGIIGIALAGYGSWMLVRWDWVLPIIMGITLVSTTDLFIESRSAREDKYRIRPVFFILVVSFFWILAATFIKAPAEVFYVSYVVNISANLGILWHRKARMAGEKYRVAFPQFITKAGMALRAAILTVLLVSPNLISDHALRPFFTLASCFCGTILVEFLYWRMEVRFRGMWYDTQFLKATAALSLAVSAIICIVTMAMYGWQTFLPGF